MSVPGGRRLVWLIVAALLGASAPRAVDASPNQQTGKEVPGSSRPVRLTGIRLVGDTALPVVELSADNGLPEPRLGVLDGPPRIYLDLAGVTVAAASSTPGLGVVTRVRVASHSLTPLVARVVIDLGESRRYKLDVSQRRAGVIRISITTAMPGAPSTTSVETPQPRRQGSVTTPGDASTETPRSSEGAGPHQATPRAAAPAPDALPAPSAHYRARVLPILEQLETIRTVLESIDRRANVQPDDLNTAAQTVAAVRDKLAALRPTREATGVHDTLRSACTLAATAVSLAQTANGHEMPLNASSAAAGALLLLDRVRSSLQLR